MGHTWPALLGTQHLLFQAHSMGVECAWSPADWDMLSNAGPQGRGGIVMCGTPWILETPTPGLKAC